MNNMPEADYHWSAEWIVKNVLPKEGVEDWTEEIRRLWRDSADRIRPLVNDFARRGELCIPIELERVGPSFRLVDGAHRVAGAYALRMYVPVNIKKPTRSDV